MSLSYRAFGQERHTPVNAVRLSDNLVMISGAGGNVVVMTGPDGLLMVDGGLPERSEELLEFVAAQFGSKRVEVLFNTHWHWEQTGSNQALGIAGARIVAHENTKLWLGAEIMVDWQKRTYKPQPPGAIPNESFYTSGEMTFGNEPVKYEHLAQAHTDGDIYVFFPRSNVLVAGDLVSVGSYPILDYSTGGWIGGMLNATRSLVESTDSETRVVPGIGPIQTRADLEAQHEMLETMRGRLVDMMRKGMGADDMLAEGASSEFDEKWGDPELFIRNAYRGMWGHVRSLGGIV